MAEAAFADEPDTNSKPITIGGYDSADVAVKGLIDYVELFYVCLAENEIKKIMMAGLV